MASRLIGLVVGGASLIALSASPASANLIDNGNFETGSLADWTATGNVAVATGADYQPCCGTTGTPAELANHFATFGSGNNTTAGTTITQAFSTTAGQKYSYSFDFGALGAGSETLQFEIVIGQSPLLLMATANDDLSDVFQTYTGTFTASASSTSITFGDLGGIADPQANNVDFILDNVSMSAVPEPSSWAMMIFGFAVVGFMAYRRESKPALTAA